MTYFNFLLIFLGIPLLGLVGLVWRDRHLGIRLPAHLQTWNPVWVVVAHIGLALGYTTPWDNYLVANGIWYYQPHLISGVLIGWVPLEEYLFFVLQTIVSGAWGGFLLKRFAPHPAFVPNQRVRFGLSGVVGIIWLASCLWLASGHQPATYTNLILSWALFPILIQCVFGADILWHYRLPISLATLSTTLYLSVSDSFAIQAGTWEISPVYSFELFLLGRLPVEEFLFFLLTNLLVAVGVSLVLAVASHRRLLGK